MRERRKSQKNDKKIQLLMAILTVRKMVLNGVLTVN